MAISRRGKKFLISTLKRPDASKELRLTSYVMNNLLVSREEKLLISCFKNYVFATFAQTPWTWETNSLTSTCQATVKKSCKGCTSNEKIVLGSLVVYAILLTSFYSCYCPIKSAKNKRREKKIMPGMKKEQWAIFFSSSVKLSSRCSRQLATLGVYVLGWWFKYAKIVL